MEARESRGDGRRSEREERDQCKSAHKRNSDCIISVCCFGDISTSQYNGYSLGVNANDCVVVWLLLWAALPQQRETLPASLTSNVVKTVLRSLGEKRHCFQWQKKGYIWMVFFVDDTGVPLQRTQISTVK